MAIRNDPIEGLTKSSPTSETNPAELVHEARKAIKRMRALARLLRDELGEQEFKQANHSLRTAGRGLAGARDADVRLQTLCRLVERHPKALTRVGVRGLTERLEAERQEAVDPSDREQVLQDIAAMRRQLARWNLVDHDFAAVSPGLRRIYREGRRRYARVDREHGSDPQDLHDWRKRVKSLYYVLDMLGAKQAKGARKATRRADRLGELLGEEHDLWMLHVYVEQHPGAFGRDTGAQKKLLKRIASRRKGLRRDALKLGARLYERKAAGFTQRIGRSLAD